MPKLKMGPIFQSDIALGTLTNIDRISVYRLRTGKVAKSMRTYLLYSAAASMIESDRAIFGKKKSALDAIKHIADLLLQWENQSIEIPENTIDIKNAVLSEIPSLTELFTKLDEVETERLIFLALWEYYNLEDKHETD